jgi:hypothetical protein
MREQPLVELVDRAIRRDATAAWTRIMAELTAGLEPFWWRHATRQ